MSGPIKIFGIYSLWQIDLHVNFIVPINTKSINWQHLSVKGNVSFYRHITQLLLILPTATIFLTNEMCGFTDILHEY